MTRGPISRTIRWTQTVIALAATCGVLLATTTAAGAAPGAGGFSAQARGAGLTGAQAGELQSAVNAELARAGGTQVGANKINRPGATVLLPLPGEKYARDLDSPSRMHGVGPAWRNRARQEPAATRNPVVPAAAKRDAGGMSVPTRQIRARCTPETITVYQAYSTEIAVPAVRAGRFVAPFRRERMTWIKPSFLWMMYRCGWATKPGQERVLAVEITRAGFEWALVRACLSHHDPALHPDRAQWSRSLKASPVRVQWDPERSLHLQPLPYRSLQVGLSREAVGRYVDEWTVAITDVTPTARRIHELLRAGDDRAARALLPAEQVLPLPAEVAAVVKADDGTAEANAPLLAPATGDPR